MNCGIITEEKEEMVLIPKLDNIRKIVTDSDTEKWRGIGILRIGGKSNGRI